MSPHSRADKQMAIYLMCKTRIHLQGALSSLEKAFDILEKDGNSTGSTSDNKEK